MSTDPSQKNADSSSQPRQIRFVHNQGQPSKRRRINAACLTCRRRKTRCSGERPLCSTCTKNGHQCLGYGDEPLRTERTELGDIKADVDVENDGHETTNGRHPPVNEYDTESKADQKPKIKTGERHEVYGPGLHPRASSPTSQAGDAESATTASKLSTTAEPDDVKPIQSEPMTSPTSRRWTQRQPQNQLHDHRNETHDHPPPQRQTPQVSHDGSLTGDSLSPLLRRAHNHRVPYFRYFGPTAIVPGYKQMVVSVRDRRRSTGGSHSGASPLSTPSNLRAGSSHAGSEVIGDDLPVYDPNDAAPVHPLIINLVQTFFSHLGCNYPFLKQAKFLRTVREKRVEPILVDAICALSARFSDAPALTNGNDKMPRTERGSVFAQRAKMATVDTFPAPSVGAVQACLLMAYEGFGANQDSALWMYLGLAIRMAVDLGLQKHVGIQYHGEKDPWYTRPQSLTSGGASESPEERRTDHEDFLSVAEQKELEQERTDTFWAVFVLDRAISSGTGRPVTLREDDFELPFPQPVVDPATGWPDPFPVFVEIIHLYGDVSDVLNKIRNIKDLTEEKWDRLIKMERQLTKMYKSWDYRLQFNVNNFKTYLGLGQGTTFILLHFWFHALFIVLHQPTLMTPFGELRSELQLLSESRELSMSSAKTICDILSFADLIDPKSFSGNPFTSQPMYIAACAFLMESSATASEAPSRETSPRPLSDRKKEQKMKSGSGKQSRHSLLASAANQNYQRCYNSLQHLHMYWGGVKYILTALDQKAKGIWDVETYTTEEYESTKAARRDSISSPFPHFEGQASPSANGPPIAWSLAGTANSPNSSLTLMYQNNMGGTVASDGSFQTAPQAPPRIPSTPPGNMVYDPIRQSLPESSMLPPTLPRSGQRHPVPRRLSDLSGQNPLHQAALKYDGMTDDTNRAKMFVPQGYGSINQQTTGYEGYGASPTNTSTDASATTRNIGPTSTGLTPAGMYYNMRPGQNLPYQSGWGAPMGNMDAFTFDSQDIDIGALGLQQPELMAGWMDYIPGDMLGIWDNQDMDQGQGQDGSGNGNGRGGPSTT